jgi:spore germination protein GerM
MNAFRAAVVAGVALLVAIVSVLLFLMTRSPGEPAATAINTPGAAAAVPSRTIKARLFYVSADGMGLTSVERDVPFADGAEQAREIIAAQIAPVAEPLLSTVPAGTKLRALFLTERGDAFVDLSREAVTAHTGGTLNELLTVYTIVNALTVNLPAVRSVQILVDGKEVQTLAGHVDLRQPLAKNQGLVQ